MARSSAAWLESGRLVLEPLRAEHADELAWVLDDIALHRFIGGRPVGVEKLRLRFEREARGRSPDGRDCWLNWAVRERATSHAVDTVQSPTIKPSEPAAVAELAWVIETRHERQGFAKEAVGLIAAWLYEQGVRSLRAHIHPCHYSSMAVARSIGLVPTQTIADGELRWQSSQPRGHADADPPHAT